MVLLDVLVVIVEATDVNNEMGSCIGGRVVEYVRE